MKSGKLYFLDILKQGSKSKNRGLVLKNVVCRIFQEIRIEKQKPRLHEILQKLSKFPLSYARKSTIVLYSRKFSFDYRADPKFEKLINGFKRLNYLFKVQNECLSEQQERLVGLINRKVNRMFKGKEYLNNLKRYRQLEIEKEEEQ